MLAYSREGIGDGKPDDSPLYPQHQTRNLDTWPSSALTFPRQVHTGLSL